jgi:hypothetical protein
MLKNIKVIYKKLGNKVWGLAHFEKNTIEIDTRLKGKKELEIILHESSHLLYPDFEEDDIINNSIIQTNLLWKLGYRKVDNSNTIPLQNGKK